jgi:transposase InsO family protein
VNPNPFSLTTLVQELVDELNILANEYNFNRPHQSLAYLAPVEYIENKT